MPDNVDIRDEGLHQIFSITAQVRRHRIINQLLRAHGGIVLSGPFAGMKLLPEVSWGDDLAPRLLGCYEAELHAALAKAVARNPKIVVNIGCAEGYYAIGMARLLPQARVFGFETSEKGQDICHRAVIANNVHERVTVFGKCESESLRGLIAQAERCLLIVDCEGDELGLLDTARLPELIHCDLIVECHDFINPAISGSLRNRFARSHEIEDLMEGARDPNQFPGLRAWQSMDRWLAVNEDRPVTMNWLVCWAR